MLAIALFLAVFVGGEVFADEFLLQTEGFSVNAQGERLVFVWEASGGRKKLTLDAGGAEKLYELMDEVHKKVEEIEFESFGDESVDTRYIESIEGEYRLRIDDFARFWGSGVFKSFLMLSPMKGDEEQPREGFAHEFLVYHHHSERYESEPMMVRMDDGEEVMIEVTPSDEYGEEFLEFLQVLGKFTGKEE